MRPNSQCDALPIDPWISRAIADPGVVPLGPIVLGQLRSQLSLRYRGRMCSDFARRVWPALKPLCGSSAVGNRHVLMLSEDPTTDPVQLRCLPLLTRSPVLGILIALRHSVFCFATRPCGFRFLPNKLLRNRQRTPSEFLQVPHEKTWELGSTPVALPHVTRANSGIQNGEQKCI
jgi:hypothetical protein